MTISSEVANEILVVLTSNIVSSRLEGGDRSGICSGDGAQVISSSGGSSGDKLLVVRGKLAIEPALLLGYPSVMPCRRGQLANERQRCCVTRTRTLS